MNKSPIPKKVLILRFSALGDILISIPLIRKVALDNPSVHFCYATDNKMTVFTKDIDNLEIIPIDFKNKYKGICGIIKWARHINFTSFDLVIDIHDVLRTKILKLLFNLYQIKVIVFDKGRKEKQNLINSKDSIKLPLKLQIDRYAEVFMNSKLLSGKTKFDPLHLNISEKSQIVSIGLAPFSKHESKMISLKILEEVVSSFKDTNVKFYIFGFGENEKKAAFEVFSKYDHCEIIINSLSFEQEVQEIQNLDLMVTMDSANSHLSALFAIPTITIYGPTHPFLGFWPLFQPIENCITPNLNHFPELPVSIFGKDIPKKYHNVINTIKSDVIIDRINQIITSKSTHYI
jgi:ADP-heptose:LPS heptosyltransferase